MIKLYLYDFIKIIVACFLGGLIGYQRQKKGMSMGLRTHLVVCVSAALVQIISIDYNILNRTNFDEMRLGAQVISGIGFLGVASIIREGRNVVGLTTAACIWFIACVGLAVGSGLYVPAVISTLVVYFFLKDVLKLDKRIKKHKSTDNIYEIEIVLDNVSGDKDKINTIFNVIAYKGAEVSDTHINVFDRKNTIIAMTISLPSGKSPNEILVDLLEYEYIRKIDFV